MKGIEIREIKYKPIGIIHSPYTDPKGTPIQPKGSRDVQGTVEIFPKYSEGLKDLEKVSLIILIYHFHLSKKQSLKVKPFLDENIHGIFATRAPNRPNTIGISIVRLLNVEKNVLSIQDVDILDNTPLLDLKPYVPKFDRRKEVRIG